MFIVYVQYDKQKQSMILYKAGFMKMETVISQSGMSDATHYHPH